VLAASITRAMIALLMEEQSRGAAIQKTAIFILAAVRTSNYKRYQIYLKGRAVPDIVFL
jgi:hypothetical protein